MAKQLVKTISILTIIFTFFSCNSGDNEMFYEKAISDSWKFRKVGDSAWTTQENLSTQQSNNYSIEYQTSFDIDTLIFKYNTIELNLNWLIKSAKVFLNDSLLLNPDSVTTYYTINCNSVLKFRNNVLRIVFDKSEKAYSKQFQHLINIDILRNIKLQAWSSVKILGLNYLPIHISEKSAEYKIGYKIESSIDQIVNYELIINNNLLTKVTGEMSLKKGKNSSSVLFSINKPKLWMPNGLGKPHLYNLTFRLKQGKTIVHEKQYKLGIKQLEYVNSVTSLKSSNYFKINSIPIFLKGVNYLPYNNLSSKTDLQSTKQIIETAKDANMNIIRFLGDNLLVDDLFYDLCDENGILVWPNATTANSIIDDIQLQNHACVIATKNKDNDLINNLLCNENIQSIAVNKNSGTNTQQYLNQLKQAESLKNYIENRRLAMPKIMDAILCQLNDSIDYVSNSTIAENGKWKLAHYAVRDAFSPILVVPVSESNRINIHIVSDLQKDTEAILLVKLIDFYDNDLYVNQIPVKIKANTSSVILSLNEVVVLQNANKQACCLVVQLNQPTKTLSQNILYFTESKNLILPKEKIYIVINEAINGYNLILKSDVLAKNIFLKTSKKGCFFADNGFDLLPNKRTKIHVNYNGTKDELINDLKINSLADVK